MAEKIAAHFHELVKLQLGVLERQAKIYHEQIESIIALTEVHPLTKENASSKSTHFPTNWNQYSCTIPSILPRDPFSSLLLQTCSKNGCIESSVLLQYALTKVKESNELATSDKIQFIIVMIMTMEYRKEHEGSLTAVEFQGMGQAYESHLDMFLDWIQVSTRTIVVDSREQALVQYILKMLSTYVPSKRTDQVRIASVLRDLRSKASTSNIPPTASSEQVHTDELTAILTTVKFKHKMLKKSEVYRATLRRNGGVFIQRKSKLECARYILTQTLKSGFNWRQELVLEMKQ